MVEPDAAFDLPLLVVLTGPTGSGKTALSFRLAERFSGEIVSCDSVAVYRGLEIGTAKPTVAERVRIPHHMIDIADPFASSQPCTAGDYSRLARAAIADISSRGCLPIVTGGTGLYLRALVEGLFPGPQRSESLRERLRASAASHGLGWLHRILSRLDPASATLVHPNDEPKLIRAIEVTLAGRQPLSTAWQSGRNPLSGYQILRIGLNPDRKALYERIDARAAAMFQSGLVDETRALLAALEGSSDARETSPAKLTGTNAASPLPWALTSLGYRQAVALLRGEMTRETAVAAAQQGHRNYAKRQMTWFRREPHVNWLLGFGDDPSIESQAMLLVADGLNRGRHVSGW